MISIIQDDEDSYQEPVTNYNPISSILYQACANVRIILEPQKSSAYNFF